MNIAALLGQRSLEAFAKDLPEENRLALTASLSETLERLSAHGDAARFTKALECLSDPARTREECIAALHQLSPWKKGPLTVRGIPIDAEWDSRQKWQRLLALKLDFQDKSMLDIGAGNGFYLRQMMRAGARFALGVEPSVLYLYQFLATSLGELEAGGLEPTQPEPGIAMLGLRGEGLPSRFPKFDVVLSMGVLYHVRSPIDHLVALRKHLSPRGQLLLETIAFEGTEREVLVPRDRYANMRNVWFVPSTELLLVWLARAGFEVEARTELVATTALEQRSTPFAPGPSLAGALDEANSSQTVEGYPAPSRLFVTARSRRIPEM